jgi:hypothetical protein
VKRRHDRGEERWRLELDASAKDGAKELRREGKRDGKVRGYLSPFIGAEGAPGRDGQGGNDQR